MIRIIPDERLRRADERGQLDKIYRPVAVGVETLHQMRDLIRIHCEAQRVDARSQLVHIQRAVCIKVVLDHELDVTDNACKLFDIDDAIRILIVLRQYDVC